MTAISRSLMASWLFQAQVDDASGVEKFGHWPCELDRAVDVYKASFPWLSLRASSQARLLYEVAISICLGRCCRVARALLDGTLVKYLCLLIAFLPLAAVAQTNQQNRGVGFLFRSLAPTSRRPCRAAVGSVVSKSRSLRCR